MFTRKQKQQTLISYIIILFITLILFVSGIDFLFISYDSHKNSREQLNNLTETLSKSISQNIDILLQSMNRTSIIILNSKEVRDAIENMPYTDNFEKNMEYYDILMLSSYAALTTKDYFSVFYYGENGNYIYSTKDYNLEKKNLFDLIEINPFDKFIMKIFAPDQNDFTINGQNRNIALVRPLINPETGTISGYIAIVSDTDDILRSGGDSTVVPTSPIPYDIKFFDSEKNIILEENHSNLKEKDYSYYATKSDFSNWVTWVGVPRQRYYNKAFRTRLIGLLICFFLIIITVLFFMKKLRKTLDPLNKLTKSMRLIQSGDFTNEIEDTTKFNDINLVYDGFNTMIHYIDNLINKVYANEIQYQKVRLEMLKLQINPHFLYNTLQTLEALGSIYEVPDVSQISHLLGKMLRYNLKSTPLVRLEAEIDSINDYLKIEAIRYGNLFATHIKVSEEALGCIVPTFILQPIVENCITHGFNELNENGVIAIDCYTENDNLIICIKDNGIGFSPEDLDLLNKNMQKNGEAENKEHVGILNVNRRIVTRYGKDYGLHVTSVQNAYTEIFYTIPKTKGDN